MAERLTPQQELAVNNRGGKLLVSAAAGSGKTKVLVDRLLGYLLDEKDPADLDDFLVITYTKAAAAELRGKIAAKLTERMAQFPENKHLQRQVQRLYLTKISTVHAFCADILREYAYRLDIPADFRVADENECSELRLMAMNRVLENAYASVDTDCDFRAFLDTQGLGRDDRLVPEILLKIYDSARCHLDPEAWLDKCLSNGEMKDIEDAGQTVWGRYLIEDLHRYLKLQAEALASCADEADASEGMEKPAALLRSTVYQLRELGGCGTWDQIYAKRDIGYGRLTFPRKGCDEDLAARIKAVREACKKGLERKLRSFSGDSTQILADMRQCSASVKGMVALVRRFGTEYGRLKRARRVLDFGDLEHRTLDLLLGIHRSNPTTVTSEIGERFREILVDEYQDSNAVQDAIFSALTSKRQNCFMVGDVKQSIYQFRLADPGIFLEKYASYVCAEEAQHGQGRKVLLSSNFRSGGGILKGVNDIFKECMSPMVGGLEYGEAEALREGIPHIAVGQPEVELLALDVKESTYLEEASLVAQRVAELLDGKHFVRQGEQLRPIRPEDIAILLRSPGSVGNYFLRALEERGIRCVSGGGEDLLQTEEIATLRSLLQVISNPRQDIPLIAVLASPLFCFSADDLAAFRGKNPRSSVYDALRQEDSAKAGEFLGVLEQLRRAARMQPLSQLMERIFVLTRVDSIYAVMPGGNIRADNLQTFYALAVEFEAAGKRDLEQFLEFLDTMEERGLTAAGEQTATGAVTLMSVHKSKGLEFPVVFVSGLSREFNRESLRAQILCDKELGLGLSAVDNHNRVRFPTVAKRAIAVKTAAESLSEEMRVLYVALTRARDRLIMTYASGSLEKDIQDLVLRMDMGSRELLTQDVVCPGQWVLMAALRRTEAGELFKLGGRPRRTAPGEEPWKIRLISAPEPAVCGTPIAPQHQMPGKLLTSLRHGLTFRYDHEAATCAPSKQTATQRKGRDKDLEAAENARELQHRNLNWRRPAFMGEQSGGTAYGNAMHICLQYIRYEACTEEAAVRKEAQRLGKEKFLTPEQVQLIDCAKIATFFQSELGQKIRAGNHVLREFKFSILEDGENYDPALANEQILLQGVVDCALIEEDGITLVDFKTDFVTEESLAEKVRHYRPQVCAYAHALERIYGRPVKKALLYFFCIDKLVSAVL